MRIVAVFILTLLLALSSSHAAPLTDWDECSNQIHVEGDEASCLRIEAAKQGAPGQVTDISGDHIFLWLGERGGNARSTITDETALLGTLYGDTNGAKGLQRNSFTLIGPRPADDALLV